MPKARQLDLFGATKNRRLKDHAKRFEHGGEIRPGRRKLARPVDPKRPIHVVLRSSRARGEWSLLSTRHESNVREIVYVAASRNDVTIYSYANSGNHLHLLVKAKSRKGFQDFARTIGALIARAVTGARKGRPVAISGGGGKFWDSLMYSRVVEWGKAYFHAQSYVLKNTLEGWNLVPYVRDSKRSSKSRASRNRVDRPAQAMSQAPPRPGT